MQLLLSSISIFQQIFRFVIYDEDGIAQLGFAINCSIGSTMESQVTASFSGEKSSVVYENPIPAYAGRLPVTGSCPKTTYFDVAFTDLSLRAYHRNVNVSSSSLSMDYAHRSDKMSICLELLDALTGEAIIAGIEVGRFSAFSVPDSESFTLPETLQSGDYSVNILVSQGRVYSAVDDDLSFVGYTLSPLNFKYRKNRETLDEYDLRVTLTAEEESLFEVEYMSPYARGGKPVLTVETLWISEEEQKLENPDYILHGPRVILSAQVGGFSMTYSRP